jgi:hypothetical protein
VRLKHGLPSVAGRVHKQECMLCCRARSQTRVHAIF